jgi:hypothetical protein
VDLVFRAFLPDIEQLQEAKIERLAELRSAHPGTDPSEDRSLEVLSRIAIDVRARSARPVEEVQR